MCACRDGKNFSGNFSVDEDILREEGMSDFSAYAAVPGTTEFMPDFFLDDFDEYIAKQKKTIENTKASVGSGGVQQVFDQMKTALSPEIVAKIQAVYAFDITGEQNHGANFFVLPLNSPVS